MSLNQHVGQYVIIRTYSAGVWFGLLSEKNGDEVILTDARRLWRWWAKNSISLSAVAVYGLKLNQSKIAPKVPNVWLQAIEIISVTEFVKNQLEGAEDAQAQ